MEKMELNDVIDYDLNVGNIGSKIDELKEELLGMQRRLDVAESASAVAANSSRLLAGRVAELEGRGVECERLANSNGQYLRRRQLEITSVDEKVEDVDLRKTVSQMLTLTGEKITENDLAVCHRLQKATTIIMEFHQHDQRDSVLRGRKNLKDKRAELSSMGLGKSFIMESLTREYRRLDYLCRTLKKKEYIWETWFFNGRLHIIRQKDGKRETISHIQDLYCYFDRELIDSLLK